MPNPSEKEILNQVFSETQKHPVFDAEPEPEVDKEVSEYFEKVEKEQFLNQPVVDDYGQPLISSPAPLNPKIVLPVSQSQYDSGMKEKISESVRWLVTWCGRIIKILGQRAVFRDK